MEEYPEELRTPPVPLVCLVGAPELHPQISSHLHSQDPPMNVLALPDFSKISVIARRDHGDKDASASAAAAAHAGGILKSGWLMNHRTRVPAVVAAIFAGEDVYGDPAQWLQVCTDLDNLKTVIRGRNIKLVVVVVQSLQTVGDATDDMNEDRLVALRKRAEIDTKGFVIFVKNDISDTNRSIARLGSLFLELTTTYYRDEARRIKLRIEKKNFSSVELNVRYNFKVAVYAEFRRDWPEALKFYENAYAVLREMLNTPAELQPIQRLIEIKVVAEQLNFKVSTLLMHGGRGLDAIKWFKQHIAWYRHLIGRREAKFLHWEWVCRQYTVFAELLQASVAGNSSLAPPVSGISGAAIIELEQQPGYYYELAALAMKERRDSLSSALEFLKSSGNSALEDFRIPSEDLGVALYVGQYPQILDHAGGVHTRSPTEEEYLALFIAEEKSFSHSHFIIGTYTKAYEQYKMVNARRMSYHIASEMGQEYFLAGEYANAKRLFESVAGLYRQEGWVRLLWTSLGYLKECAKQLNMRKEYVEYSLEMASLPILSDMGSDFAALQSSSPYGPFCHSQRIAIQHEICSILQGKRPETLLENGDDVFSVMESDPLSLEIDVVSPLRGVLLAYVAFHEQSMKPEGTSSFTLALLTHLPQAVEVGKLEIQFNQSQCNFHVLSERKNDLSEFSKHEGIRVETVPDLELKPDKWKRFSFTVTAGVSGKLECLSVIAHVGLHSSICCRAESPASTEDLHLWKFEDMLCSHPIHDGNLSFSGQKFIQVEEPDPLVDLELKARGPGLVGEAFPVSVTVNCKENAMESGEMKINIVESKLGSSTNRDSFPASAPPLDVELLAMLDNGRKYDGLTETHENARKLSGVIKLPQLEAGMKRSTELFIKWHKPKMITLYVSVGYHSRRQDGKEETSQKVHLHKSLQLEGRNALSVSHKYMPPFRRDSLLVADTYRKSSSDSLIPLGLNENTVLLVTTKNLSNVPVKLLSIGIDQEKPEFCSVRHCNAVYSRVKSNGTGDSGGDHNEPIKETSPVASHSLLMPNEVYTKIFTVCPSVTSPELCIGSICIRWKRHERSLQAISDEELNDILAEQYDVTTVTTHSKLAPVRVEKPALIVNLKCPSHAILGIPFTFSIDIQNETCDLQEIKLQLVDSQSFLAAGIHSDTISILPYSNDVLSYKLIPLASGCQQLPQVVLTALNYSTGFNPSPPSTQLFVFPSEPVLQVDSSKLDSFRSVTV